MQQLHGLRRLIAIPPRRCPGLRSQTLFLSITGQTEVAVSYFYCYRVVCLIYFFRNFMKLDSSSVNTVRRRTIFIKCTMGLHNHRNLHRPNPAPSHFPNQQAQLPPWPGNFRAHIWILLLLIQPTRPVCKLPTVIFQIHLNYLSQPRELRQTPWYHCPQYHFIELVALQDEVQTTLATLLLRAFKQSVI